MCEQGLGDIQRIFCSLLQMILASERYLFQQGDQHSTKLNEFTRSYPVFSYWVSLASSLSLQWNRISCIISFSNLLPWDTWNPKLFKLYLFFQNSIFFSRWFLKNSKCNAAIMEELLRKVLRQPQAKQWHTFPRATQSPLSLCCSLTKKGEK